MKKIILSSLFFILILSFIILDNTIINSTSKSNSIDALPYIHTKAICSQNNYCQDYEIECQRHEAVRVSPVTGASIQHSPEWQDPRDEKTRSNLCK
jgi:hypothetical protein